MNNLTGYIRDELRCHGAALVGFGDLNGLPPETRDNMPVGVSIAVAYPKDVIRGIAGMPTQAFYDQYGIINIKLEMLMQLGTEALRLEGYEAIPLTESYVDQTATDYSTLLPHKTVATRAGLGWIGKSALLVTEQYGTMVRLSSILTNAPLKTAKPVSRSKCGDCDRCTKACPADAILGKLWSVEMERDALLDAPECRKTARSRAKASFGIEITQCGKCIYICPYTQRYLNGGD